MGIVTTGLYPEDLYGTNPQNLIPDEEQPLNPPGDLDYFFIIPKAAPFFVRSLIVTNPVNNQELIEGKDYIIGHRFIEAMESTGKGIAGSIRFLRRDLGPTVRLRYQTLGGVWGFNDVAILAELARITYNPVIRSWGMIEALPYSFPPTPHDQSVNDFVGSTELKAAIDGVTAAIAAAATGMTEQHIHDYNNPHRVDKVQINLGNVLNYAVATDLQAVNPSFKTAYMTPYTTALMTNALAVTPLNAHINARGNVHGLVKGDIDLGNVDNFKTATATEALDVTINNRFMTPYTASVLIESYGITTDLQDINAELHAHIANTNNPHGLTPAVLNVYDIPTIDQMFATLSGGGGDASRFGGLTPDQWRESLPSVDDVTLILTTMTSEFNHDAGIVPTDVVMPVVVPIEESDNYITGARCMNRCYAIENASGVCVARSDGAITALNSITLSGLGLFTTNLTGQYYVNANGRLMASGGQSFTVPSPFNANNPPDPISKLDASSSQVYIHCDSGALYSFGAAGGLVTIATDVADFWVTELGNGIKRDTNGVYTAFGPSGWVTAFNTRATEINALDIEEVLLSESFMFFRLASSNLRAFNYTVNGNTYTLANQNLPSGYPVTGYASMSGKYKHIALVTLTGQVYFMGTDTSGETEVPSTYRASFVECGNGYTVAFDLKNTPTFFGYTDSITMRPANKRTSP